MSATESTSLATEILAVRKRGSPLAYFLAFIFALFIGILVFCYVVTRRANPVFLDQHGKPVAASSEHSH